MSATSVVLVAALLFSLASVALSQAQNLQNFNIGSEPGQMDVVLNGEEFGNWNPSRGPNDFNVTSWPPPVYYVWIANAATYETVNMSVRIYVTGAIEMNLTQSEVLVTKGTTYNMMAPLLCDEPGIARGRVEITINDPPNAKGIALTILKDCEFPLFNVGFRCSKGYCPKVIDDNVLDPTWSYIVGRDEGIPWFYIWLSNASLVPWSEFQVYVSHDQPLNLVSQFALPNGDMASQYTTAEHSSLDLDLYCQYNRLPSLANISITIAPKYWDITGDQYKNNTVTFWIGKQCGDLTGNPRPGFSIGTTNYADDVVSNGLTVQAYRDFTYPWRVSNLYQPFPLYFSLRSNGSYAKSVNYNATFVETQEANVAVVTESGKLTAFLNADEGSQIITVDFNCLKSGTEQIILTVDVRDGDLSTAYDHVVIYFQKQCILPSFDIAFAGDNSLLMQNNRYTYSGLIWKHTSTADTLVDGFLFSLNPASPVTQQNFVVKNFAFNPNLLKMVVDNSAPTMNGLSTPVRVNVIYDCVMDKPSSTNISFDIDFGWEVSWTVAYTKECNSVSGSSTGWNAAEIFFFTVFILLLAFFIFGSMYKYFAKHQRGWDIIPGITYFRKCCSCCPGSSARYTPQMDTDYVTTEEKGAKHTTYGTHSYQPNL